MFFLASFLRKSFDGIITETFLRSRKVVTTFVICTWHSEKTFYLGKCEYAHNSYQSYRVTLNVPAIERIK